MFSPTGVPYPKRRQPQHLAKQDENSDDYKSPVGEYKLPPQPSGPAKSTSQRISENNVHFELNRGKSRLPAAVALHGEIFKTDPVINYLLHDLSTEARRNYIPDWMGTLLNAASLNGAVFDEAWVSQPPNDSSTPPFCSAVWMPPGRKVESLRTYVSPGMFRMLRKAGLSGIRRMLGDFQSCANKAKRKGLGRADGSLTPCWYLFFVGTVVEARGQKLASQLIQKAQGEIRMEGTATPIWLEATTENSMRLYERLEFEHVESWVLGKGEVDATGEAEKGGEGVRVWAMIWHPEQDKRISDMTPAAAAQV